MKPNLPTVFRPALAALALSLSLSVPLHAADATKDVIEKSFTLSGTGKLVSNVDAGSITVTGGDSKNVVVKVTREAENANASEAAKLFKDYEVILTQDGNTIRADGKAPRNTSWGWNKPRLKVKFEIVVPRKTDAEIGVGGGSAKVEDLTGTITTKAAGGSITAAKLAGTIGLHSGGGSIQAETISGDLTAKTAGGSISLKAIEGGKVIASSSGGSIHINGGSGKFNLHSAGGGIKLEEGKGSVDAHASGGSIGVQLTEAPKESMTLKTAGGGISLKIPANTSANLDASAAGGSVTCDLPVTVQGKIKNSSIEGKLGEGGPELNLHSSGGSIKISKS